MIVFMIVFLAALIIQKTYIYAHNEDTVNYDSLTDEADYSEIDSTLDDYGWKGTSFKELVRSVASSDTDISPLNTSIAVPTHRTTDTKVPIEEPVLFKTRARITPVTAHTESDNTLICTTPYHNSKSFFMVVNNSSI